MRKFFEQFGCEMCLEGRKAINIFNSHRPLERQIQIESIGGTSFFGFYPEDQKWMPLGADIWSDEETIRVPFLIFDDIVIRRVDDWISFLVLLEELDRS